MTTPSSIIVDPAMSQRQQDRQMIAAYLEHLRRRGCTADTIKLRRSILTNLNRDLEDGLGNTDAAELGAWLHDERRSLGTRSTYGAGLKSFYAWAADPRDPWISHNPMLDVEQVSPPEGVAHPFSDDELARILGEAGEPVRLWVVLAAYAGLRCVEISRLDREHVSRQQLVVVAGKGGRPRVHDTHDYVWQAVRDLPAGPVARTRTTGVRATPGYVSTTAWKRIHELGLEGGLHSARHWLGVNTQRHYRDIRVTQAVLGHRSLNSTQRYTQASMDQQREARASLPRLAG